MDIYINKHQLSTIILAGFTKMEYTDTKLQQNLTKSGNGMNGILDMDDDRITGVLNSATTQDASTKIYADNIGMFKLAKAGDVMSNNLDMNLNKITVATYPVAEQDLVTKHYLTTTYGGY